MQGARLRTAPEVGLPYKRGRRRQALQGGRNTRTAVEANSQQLLLLLMAGAWSSSWWLVRAGVGAMIGWIVTYR